MSIEVKIPAVGESITSGVVSVWHKKSGDFVNEGEALFTLETDKVSTEIVAEKAGVLETKVPEGREVKIGEVVATIDDSKAPPEEKKTEKPPEKNKRKNPRQRKRAQKKRLLWPRALTAAGRGHRPRLQLFHPPFGALSKKNMSSRRKSPGPAKKDV